MGQRIQSLLSSRAKNIQESKSLEVYAMVQTLKSKGERVISLIVGEPTDPPSQPILDATINAINQKKTGYSLVAGELALREKLAKHYQGEGFSPVDIHSILISNGSKHSLYNIFQVLCDMGTEIIIPTPFWVTFPESVKLAGGVPVFVETDATHIPNIKDIEQKITAKTKAIVINCPNNPSGVIYSEELRSQLIELCTRHNIFLISDEAYDQIVYDNREFKATALLSSDWREQVITVRSFSKTYAMTGYRIGVTIAHPTIINALNKLQGHLSGNNCTFAQYGAIAALDTLERDLQIYRKTYEHKRNLAHRLFNIAAPVEKPPGAFYLFMDIRKWLGKFFKSSNDFCMALLQQEKLAVLPGSAFGKEGYIRISFAVSDTDIEEGAKKLIAFMERQIWK